MSSDTLAWPAAPELPSLAPDEVHLWCAPLDYPAQTLEQLSHLLEPAEQARAARYYFERDRRRFIAGRALLRSILARYAACPPAELRFSYQRYGKPELAYPSTSPGLSFNLAHSQALALYAVTWGHALGIDLEQLRALPDAQEIAARFFAPQERAALQALPPELQTEGFFNCWTRKEAYIKACGAGLSRALDGFTVSLAPGEPARLISVADDPQAAERWWLQHLVPAPGYVGALAIAGARPRLACWRWQGLSRSSFEFRE